MPEAIKIRPGTSQDLPFLQQMLFEAFFWQPDAPRPDFREFRQHPEFHKLLAGWGRPGDTAVIAVADDPGTPVGAAWYRFWSAENHSYGFVDAATPELGIAVHARHRGQGVGRALLQALIDTARNQGVRALSLSVAPENFACQLYESAGFVKVGKSGTSWTMVLRL